MSSGESFTGLSSFVTEPGEEQAALDAMLRSGWTEEQAYLDLPMMIESQREEAQKKHDDGIQKRIRQRAYGKKAPPIKDPALELMASKARERAKFEDIRGKLGALGYDALEVQDAISRVPSGNLNHIQEEIEFRRSEKEIFKTKKKTSVPRVSIKDMEAQLIKLEAERKGQFDDYVDSLLKTGGYPGAATYEGTTVPTGPARQAAVQFAKKNWAQWPIHGKVKALRDAIESRKYERTFSRATGEALAGEVEQFRAVPPIAPVIGGTAAFPGTAFAPMSQPKKVLEERPWEALIDARTGRLLPDAYRSLLGAMGDGAMAEPDPAAEGTLRYGPTQFERTGEHFEESPDAIREHMQNITQRYKEKWEAESTAPGVSIEPTEEQKAQGITSIYQPGTVSAVGRVELPGEFTPVEEVLGVKRAGLSIYEAPEILLKAAGLTGKSLVQYLGSEQAADDFVLVLQQMPGRALTLAKNIISMPGHTLWSLTKVVEDLLEGGERTDAELREISSKVTKAWAESEHRFEHMPDRSYVQEAWDMAEGMVFGLSDVATRAYNKATTEDDLNQLNRAFVDGAIEFATPMAHSVFETAKGLVGESDIFSQAPIEAALNLLMVKAPLVKGIRGKVASKVKEIDAAKAAIRADALELRKQLQPLTETVAGPYPKERALDRARRMQPMVEAINKRAMRKIKALDDANVKTYRLDILADIIDGAGIIPGEFLFSSLAIAKAVYRRTVKGAIGKATTRWWLAPRDVRLPESFQAMYRERMAVHSHRMLAVEEAVRAIPKKLRPTVEEFMWMEHEPFFSSNPQRNFVHWNKKDGRWKLTEKGREKAGVGKSRADLTPDELAFRTSVASKISAANIYGRNLVRQVHELSAAAIAEGMFADPMSLREIYWPNIYSGKAKKLIEKGEPRLATALDGGEFLTNKLRALGIPIEARQVRVGGKIPDSIIQIADDAWIELPDHLKEYSMRVERGTDSKGRATEKHYFNPREHLIARNKTRSVLGVPQRKGGWGMEAGLLDNAMEGLGRLSADVALHKNYRAMLMDVDLVSYKKKPGYIYVDDLEMRAGISNQWRGILKKADPDSLIARAEQAGVDGNLVRQYRNAVRNKKGSTRLRNKIIDGIIKRQVPKKYGKLSGKWIQ